MEKLLLLSLLVAHIVIPARYAKGPDARLQMKRMIKAMLLFNLFYLFGLLYIYPRLGG